MLTQKNLWPVAGSKSYFWFKDSGTGTEVEIKSNFKNLNINQSMTSTNAAFFNHGTTGQDLKRLYCNFFNTSFPWLLSQHNVVCTAD
jgi:hypothetical protein